jgi:hypothetical protein
MPKQPEQEPTTLEHHLGRQLAQLKGLDGRTLTDAEQEKRARLQKNVDVSQARHGSPRATCRKTPERGESHC